MKDVIANQFIRFGEQCKNYSPMYEFFSYKIAKDDLLLDLCTYVKEGQPIPNLLFAAVQFLLYKGYDHPLKTFYPSIVDEPKEHKHAFPYFRDFCQKFKQEIIHLLQTKNVQTNEVRRCTFLYPCFSKIYKMTRKPLALIEIGTSAGLQLLFDQYSYSYSTEKRYGNVKSNVHLSTKIRGKSKPVLSENSPPVQLRIGIDLNIVDLSKDEDRLWLLALIWPEHEDRRKKFIEASNYFLKHKSMIEFIEGDGVQLLPSIMKNIPTNSTLCIFHTFVANQMSKEVRQTLLETIKKIGQQRDVFHLYNHITDSLLHLDYYINGREYTTTIADIDDHGQAFTWLCN